VGRIDPLAALASTGDKGEELRRRKGVDEEKNTGAPPFISFFLKFLSHSRLVFFLRTHETKNGTHGSSPSDPKKGKPFLVGTIRDHRFIPL
jgi:hypothetical protein